MSHAAQDSFIRVRVPLCVGIVASTLITFLAVAEPPLLEPHRTNERQIGGGQLHLYQLSLQAGQHAKVAIDQQTIGVAITILGPDGKVRFQIDNDSIGEQEIAELIADSTGIYQVQVAPSSSTAPAGRYTVTLDALEPSTDRHYNRIRALRAQGQATVAIREDTRNARLRAIPFYEQALANWREANEIAEQARTFRNITLNYIELGMRPKALESATKGLETAQSTHDPKLIARAFDSLGEVHNYFDDKRKAIEYYEQALALMRQAGDRAGEAKTTSNLGVAWSGTGDKRKALACYEKAMRMFTELQDRRMLAEVSGNMGVAYDNLGEYARALESHEKDLALERELEGRSSQAIALNNVGNAYSGLGAYQKALDAYASALEINKSLDNRWNTAINLNNIAWVYASLGDRRHALRFYQDSLAIVRVINDQRRTATTLNNIANIHSDLGDYRRAIEIHNEALPLRRKVGDADGEANSLNGLGQAYFKLGDREQARGYFESAMAIHRTAGNRHMMARTLRNLGALNRESGDYPHALESLNEALQISRDIHDRSGEAEALGSLARVYRDTGELDQAHEYSRAAVGALESARLQVISPALRASLFASARDLQELHISILMLLHRLHPEGEFGAAALVSNERGRARSLLEMLGESGQPIRRGVDGGLLNREREIERLIAAKAEQQTRVLSGKHRESDAATAQKELDTLAAELEQVQSRIRTISPEYAALTQPEPLSVREIQTQVLDDETVLLEYSFGSQKSFLWVVTPGSLHIFDLPGRSEIETAAKRVYDLLTARNHAVPNETPAATSARVRRADAGYRKAAADAAAILLRPAASLLTGKRLLVVGEGVLQYLPFGALPDPDLDAHGAAAPLILNHEVITAPSASVLAVLRRETSGRNAAPKSVAIFADPVFSANDPRVGSQLRTAAPPDQDFVRLRFSRNEAEEIARLAPAGSTLKALDFDANRETALSPDLAQYRIIHFATHSQLNNTQADLSGVVLSLVDRQGRPRNGFLRLYDIYNLRLKSDLVVLSACQTALGEDIRGEGLIGLTRGFLYAGAPRVLATLWEIDDRTTSELMKRFYTGVLTRKERPAAALRTAQVELWRDKGWDAPYYWAAFTLQGEWR